MRPGDFIITPSWTWHDLRGYEPGPLRAQHGAGAARVALRRHVADLHYPYDRSLEALHRLERDAPVDPWAGVKLRYTNPLIAVYSVVEGTGRVDVEGGRSALEFRALATRPFRRSLMAHCPAFVGQGCVLFSVSDRPVHDALALHKEERLS